MLCDLQIFFVFQITQSYWINWQIFIFLVFLPTFIRVFLKLFNIALLFSDDLVVNFAHLFLLVIVPNPVTLFAYIFLLFMDFFLFFNLIEDGYGFLAYVETHVALLDFLRYIERHFDFLGWVAFWLVMLAVCLICLYMFAIWNFLMKCSSMQFNPFKLFLGLYDLIFEFPLTFPILIL